MQLFTTYFTNTQVTLLSVALFAFLFSLYFQVKEKERLAVGFLLLTAASVFSFAALLDPFLNLWDERFHALVGKNMMDHPFKPTLYDDPVVNTAYDYWDKYHVWLHKQPLFLWQIALSFKLLGISEFTLRLPCVVLAVALVFITYRSGKLLVNERVGYVAGILTISTIYLLELVSGRQELEHNDLTFLVYISLSIWSFIEYSFSGKRIWILFIGLFSGMAILCKWLVGLLVYFGWVLLKILQKKYKFSENKDWLSSLLVTLLVALPWQIYTFIRFPNEAANAYKFNTGHFTDALDGHSGTFWYHFEMFHTMHGTMASILIIPAFYMLYKKCRDKQLLYALLGMVVVVFLFFTLASTKMPSFTTVVLMTVFIALAAFYDAVLDYIKKININTKVYQFIFFFSIVFIMLARFDIEFLQEKHTNWKGGNTWTQPLIHNRAVFKSLRLPGNAVLFNAKGRHYIEAMFYTGLPAYNFIPTNAQYYDLRKKGRSIAMFKLNDKELPDYLEKDSTLIVIDEEVQGDD